MDGDIRVETLELAVKDLVMTEKNPRSIAKKDFEVLKRSVKEFPSMLKVREVVVDENNRILGGHQRVRALKAQGIDKVTVKKVSGWSDEQKDEFLIKDNIANGDWDTDKLANEWDKVKLEEWGLPIKVADDTDYECLLNVEIPHYTPSEHKPDPEELVELNEVDELLEEIGKVKMDKKLKRLMETRASFFAEFNFQKIADYYYHSDDGVKELLKKLGLVIVVPREAFLRGMCDFRRGFAGDEE